MHLICGFQRIPHHFITLHNGLSAISCNYEGRRFDVIKVWLSILIEKWMRPSVISKIGYYDFLSLEVRNTTSNTWYVIKNAVAIC